MKNERKFTIEEEAKVPSWDTIADQRKFLTQQRSEAIRNRPPTKNQLRNQMMTYLKHVGGNSDSELKKPRRKWPEKMIKRGMIEKEIDSLRNEMVKDESKEEVKGRKENIKKNKVTKKKRKLEINQNVVIRSNGQKRYFSTLMRVLSIFDRDDLNVVYQLVMDRYQDEILEGFDRVLWGDLMVMFNPDDEDKFWNSQQDWNIRRQYPFEEKKVQLLAALEPEELSDGVMDGSLSVGVKTHKLMVIRLPCLHRHKTLAKSIKLMGSCGKDFSNRFMVDNLAIKTCRVLKLLLAIGEGVRASLKINSSWHLASQKQKRYLVKDKSIPLMVDKDAKRATGKEHHNTVYAGSLPIDLIQSQLSWIEKDMYSVVYALVRVYPGFKNKDPLGAYCGLCGGGSEEWRRGWVVGLWQNLVICGRALAWAGEVVFGMYTAWKIEAVRLLAEILFNKGRHSSFMTFDDQVDN
ncbi:hypothetical protein Tco_1354248 [Tanacetum coccineum]